MRHLKSQIAASHLKKIALHEYEFAETLSSPAITDFNEIPKIVQFCNANSQRDYLFTLGVIYKLVAPYKLYFDHIKTPIGMRDIISSAMGHNSPEIVSMNGNRLIAYYKGKWANRVNDMADNYLKAISKVE